MNLAETRLEALAESAAFYHQKLRDRSVPPELAAQLVRDWHLIELQKEGSPFKTYRRKDISTVSTPP